MKFSLVHYALPVVAIILSITACSVQSPRFVRAKHTKPPSYQTVRIENVAVAPVHATQLLEHSVIQHALPTTPTRPARVQKKELTRQPQHRVIISSKQSRHITAVVRKNYKTTYANTKVTEHNNTRRYWMAWLALIIPAWLVTSSSKFGDWMHKMLTSKTLLRVLMGYMLLRGYGGYATIMRVMMGTEPAFALGIGYANLAFGMVALLLLVLSAKGGLKDLRVIIRSWNAFGFAMLFVSLLVFIAHGMLPAVPFYLPLSFMIAHTLIHLITKKKNYDELH